MWRGGSGVGRGEGVKGGVKGDRSSLPTGVFLKAGIALWGEGFATGVSYPVHFRFLDM